MEGTQQPSDSLAIGGLGDDYVHVDSSEKLVDLQMQDEFQLMPTQAVDPFSLTPTNKSEVTLRNSAMAERTADIALSMDSSEPNMNSDLGVMETRPPPGKTAAFLESKGFGWLMEVEDQEEDLKPLL